MAIQLTLAEKISITRKRLEDTQEEFGRRFNVKQLTVSQWEAGASPNQDNLALLNTLFQQVLGEDDEDKVETAIHQLLLPFDQPVNIDFRISPGTAEKAVRCSLQIKRKVG